MLTRRNILLSGAAMASATALAQAQSAPTTNVQSATPGGSTIDPHSGPLPPGEPGRHYTPVVTPDGATLPFKVVDGVKVFHLIAEPCKREFAPGLVVDCWGYNGLTPGPTIEAVEGDRVRIFVTNKLPSPTSVHWHGILLPNGMDGVSGLTQKPIEPGATYKYEFTLRQYGTFMYHPHFDEMTQQALGMMGMFVIHPRNPGPERPKVERDFAILLSEWRIIPGTSRPDPNEMTDFNIFTMNSKVYPGTSPLVARTGQRVRLRIGNLGAMDHHPIHIHGFNMRVTGTDGGPIPPAGQWPETSVLVPVGSTRDAEFVADAPGDWALHCHMSHHAMNQMGHGTPNLIGMDKSGFDARARELLPGYMTMGDKGMGGHGAHMKHMKTPPNSIPMIGADGPFGYIDMGGMFTVIKVRDDIDKYDDPGWYKHPDGTVAGPASEDELRMLNS
jgi:FtsP/CotA-like multicopper oxidase with cupredoxin domain